MLQVLLATAAFTTSLGTSSKLAMSQLRGGALSMSTAVAIVVDVEVKPDRLDEFMVCPRRTAFVGPTRRLSLRPCRAAQGVIEADAVGSQQEAGCVRFDVLRDQSNPNRFFFYEVCHASPPYCTPARAR